MILKSILKKTVKKKKKHLTSLGIDEIYPQLQHVPLLFRSFCLLPPNPQTGADSVLIAPDAFERLPTTEREIISAYFFAKGNKWAIDFLDGKVWEVVFEYPPNRAGRSTDQHQGPSNQHVQMRAQSAETTSREALVMLEC